MLSRPARGETGAVAPVAGRQHAVEQVVSHADEAEEILRQSDAHQVARPLLRQRRRRHRRHLPRDAALLPDTQTPHRIAWKVERGKLRRVLAAQVGDTRPPCTMPKQLPSAAISRRRSARPGGGAAQARSTAPRSASAATHSSSGMRMSTPSRRWQVDDVLRGEEQPRAVEVRAERDALVGDLAQRRPG